MRYIGNKSLATQKTMFDEIAWLREISALRIVDVDNPVAGRPVGILMGLKPTSVEAVDQRVPYWEFTYRLDSAQGLIITNAVARDTQPMMAGAPSREPVFQRIDFTDLVVTFDDDTTADFNVGRAIAAGTASFVFKGDGRRTTVDPVDRLMHYGLRLVLTDNVLGNGGTCNVTLEFAVVFRGASNDFDPGRVPVALGCYPQLAWTWSSAGATKLVARFRGSVRITVDNVMSHAHGGHLPPDKNIAGFYADSNTSFDTLGNMPPLAVPPSIPIGAGTGLAGLVADNRASIYGFAVMGGRLRGLPASWGMVFDYLWANFTEEKEIVGVYGQNDGNFYTAERRANYLWPSAGGHDDYNRYVVKKLPRQGQYDNIHLHADMGRPDKFGNAQIHAPFCGHSCLHMHWRWSAIAGRGAGERAWYYNGWSPLSGGKSTAHSTPGAPLVPPNQRVKVAVCAPRARRHDSDRILDPTALGRLPDRNKVIWYSAEILKPAAGEKQVICEHGIGWAYRYAMQDESDAVDGMASRIAFLPVLGTAPSNQAEMSDFFEDHVYPGFRYVEWHGTRINQIPNGDYDRTHRWGSRNPDAAVKAEDL
jgi:hypothetical protein